MGERKTNLAILEDKSNPRETRYWIVEADTGKKVSYETDAMEAHKLLKKYPVYRPKRR